MRFLGVERDTLAGYLPALHDGLAQLSLTELEQPKSPGIGLFRDAGGCGLLVPAKHHGAGASALDACRVQRAVGSRSPSLAVATTMHHFSVATLFELAARGEGLEWILLQAIADSRLVVASGFAEGQPGQHVLKPALRARRVPGGFRVSGVKKPCSLTWSMDLLTASVQVLEEDGSLGHELVVLQIPAGSPGIERRPFWGSWVLAGAESDEVVLTDVYVPEKMAIYPDDTPGAMDPLHARGFVWFELLISASYLGIASALAERVIAAGRGTAGDRVGLAVETETAMAALERVALSFDRQEEVDLGRALLVRFGVQRAVERTAMQAAALVGGMAFIGSPEVAYLLAASRALAYHPPSLGGAADALDGYLAGREISLD